MKIGLLKHLEHRDNLIALTDSVNQGILPLSNIQHGGGEFAEGLCCWGWGLCWNGFARLEYLDEWSRMAILRDRTDSCGCRRETSGRVWTQRETWQLWMLERDLGSSEDSERNLGSNVDSERDLVVADVREGSHIECGLRARPEDLSLTRNGQLVCRVCCSLKTLLMWWDTCHDLNEGQNLTTIYASQSFDCQSHGRRIRSAKLAGAFRYLLVILEIYASKDLVY